MLSTMRKSWLLFTLLAIVAVSSALSIEEALHIDGIEEYLHHGVKRQVTGTGNVEATSDTPTPSAEPSSSDAPASTPTPTPTPTPAPQSSDTPQQSSAAPSNNQPTRTGGSNNQPSSSAVAGGNSSPQATEAPTSTRVTTPIVRTTPLVSTSVGLFTTVYTTQSDGQNVAVTAVSSGTALITTGTAVATELPSPADGNGNSSGGLTDNNKKIIGGVVGGVGGAILLGGIALVCWRIWGRKKRVSEDDDDLMAGTGSALGDKPDNANSPFQNNLDQYHNPGGRPNAAANF